MFGELLKKISLHLLCVILNIFILYSCKETENTSPHNNKVDDTYDINKNEIPKLVNADYIELQKIYRISKFRSSVGHSYTDNFESCRSMKHYFELKNYVDWSTIKIFSPVNGVVSKIYQEWAGTQIQIKSKEIPAFYFIIFHINLSAQMNVGDSVKAGQHLGNHIGSQTMSDIAVGVNTPEGWRLLSYFDVMSDTIFTLYKNRGINSRSELIITKEARDADTLICNGNTFTTYGMLENWVVLSE